MRLSLKKMVKTNLHMSTLHGGRSCGRREVNQLSKNVIEQKVARLRHMYEIEGAEGEGEV